MTATQPPKPRLRRPVLWISIAAGLVLAFGAVAAGYAVGAGPSGGEAAEAVAETPSARPEPESSAPSAPLPEPSEEPVSVIPASCAGIYSTDWSAQLGPELMLNPSWAEDPANGVRYGTDDEGLQTVLESTTQLTCIWGDEHGEGGGTITTNLAMLSPEQQESTLAHLAGTADSCYEEIGGTRCTSEVEHEGKNWGESHFVREGIWVATKWVYVAPDGYTHDIVNTLWP